MEKGHRDIGVLGGNWASSQISRRRLQGCRRAFESRGVPFDPGAADGAEPVLHGGGLRCHQAAVGPLPRADRHFRHERCDGHGVIRALRDMDKRVPEDISVVGYDGISMGRYTVPRLTTICQDTGSLAERGVDLLLDNLRGGAPVHGVVPFRLVDGESVAQISHRKGAADNMRRAGVLMPISSLPSPWGIGTLGAAAGNSWTF